jgi:hypothetical protein
MESPKNCVYNQTRECFLGLEVTAADVTYTDLREAIRNLALKSGEGLWMLPFRGIPDSGVLFPLDLIYLDDDCRVVDQVESFPTFRVSPFSPRAASVLALPAHTIYSSQTQPGDQLVICVAGEMERRLERLSSSKGSPVVVQNAVLLREKPLWSGGPGLLQLEDRRVDDAPKAEPAHEMALVEPGMKTAKPPRNWLERWWSPDPRKAPRNVMPGLAAYYWTGATPRPHSIRDISSSGLYVVTEERWYPGTLILMTLQRTDGVEETAERSISVHSRAVRWGSDGVGLQFLLMKSQDSRNTVGLPQNGADRKALDKFLQGLARDRELVTQRRHG